MDIKKSSQSIVTKNISLKKSFCIFLLLLSKYKEINLLSRYIIKQNSSRQKNSRNLVKKKTHDIPVEREKFPTYHKLTHHTIKSTKYSQLQSTTYCC